MQVQAALIMRQVEHKLPALGVVNGTVLGLSLRPGPSCVQVGSQPCEGVGVMVVGVGGGALTDFL